MKQLPDKFSVYAATIEEAEYIAQKQKELCKGNANPIAKTYYRFCPKEDKYTNFGQAEESYLTRYTSHRITHEFTFNEFKSYFEEEFVLPRNWCIRVIKEKEKTDIIDKWKFQTNWKDHSRYYTYVAYNGSGMMINDAGYTEITFDQFKQYVLKETNMKEIIGYRLKKDCEQYREACKKIKLLYNNLPSSYLDGDTEIYSNKGDNVLKEALEKAKVWDLWFEPVYKETKILPTILGYKGKEIGEQIKFGCRRFNKHMYKELYNTLKSFGITSYKIAAGEVKTEEIGKIVEYLNEQK